jgi:hypothetical protein
MNSKSVLSKIAKMLNLTEEVTFTEAQTKDGTILESPTFDVGETVDVVSEDGTKTPAPDGEHEISLKDTEGNEVLIKVITKDGVITERENVELESDSEVEIEVEKEAEMADVTTEIAKGLPNTTDESKENEIPEPDTKDPIISLTYRMGELESKLKSMMEKFESAFPQDGPPEVSSLEPIATTMSAVEPDEEEEEEFTKLDGAPIESVLKFAEQSKNNFGKKAVGYQASVLAKINNI